VHAGDGLHQPAVAYTQSFAIDGLHAPTLERPNWAERMSASLLTEHGILVAQSNSSSDSVHELW